MTEVVYCVNCKYSQCRRDGESALKYGKGMECSLHVFSCPNDYDFCSRGKKIIKCKNCGKRFDNDIPNFCPNCGTKMYELKESKIYWRCTI